MKLNFTNLNSLSTLFIHKLYFIAVEFRLVWLVVVECCAIQSVKIYFCNFSVKKKRNDQLHVDFETITMLGC